VRDHVHIGARAILGAKAGISSDVADGAQMLGTPAGPLREVKLRWALEARLPEMREQLRQLQRQMNELLGGDADRGDQAAA
jgi:UDP-3-O-[3-hydroxymyristoyl] glucosamine N-acyltransferase